MYGLTLVTEQLNLLGVVREPNGAFYLIPPQKLMRFLKDSIEVLDNTTK